MNIFVTVPDQLSFNGRTYKCASGRGGIKTNKQEGDGATPAGTFALRKVLYRPDRVQKPKTNLPIEPLGRNDAWCDDINCPAYNTQVKLPHNGSFEELWREDDLYDILAVVGYNDAPPVPGNGSAIFLHIARPEYTPTAGCIALNKEDLLEVLAAAGPDTMLAVNG